MHKEIIKHMFHTTLHLKQKTIHMFDYTTIVKDHFATNSPDPLRLIIMAKVLAAEEYIVSKQTVWATIRKYKMHGTLSRLLGTSSLVATSS